MQNPKIFFAGAFVALLLFKPAFTVAFVSSIGNVVSAMVSSEQPVAQRPVQQITEEIIVEGKEPDNEKQDQIFSLISQIVERLDRIETGSKSSDLLTVSNGSVGAKELAYKRALEDQAMLEKQAGYDGNDPVIRDRMKLPPKVPPFNLFMVNGEMEPAQFDKEFANKH